MLVEKIFKDGINELIEVFPTLILKPKTLQVWYKYSKHLDDYEWQKKIANCIKGCRKVPTLADILDIKGYYREDSTRPYDKEFEEEEYIHEPKSEEVKKQIERVKANINMPVK